MEPDEQMHLYMRGSTEPLYVEKVKRGPVNRYLRRRYGCVWHNRPSSWLLSWPRRLLLRWRSR